MSKFKFKEEEIFRNTAKVHPSYKFIIYSGTVYIDVEKQDSGSFSSASLGVPEGYISLYEMNIDRKTSSNNFIYPFLTKNGSLSNFKSVTTSSFHSNFQYGDTITGSYPLSSSLYRNYYPTLGTSGFYDSTRDDLGAYLQRPHIVALKNTLNYYKTWSEHYEYSGSKGEKAKQELNLISVPSIFYGSEIKKGSVKLNFYVTGTLIGTLQDSNKNGELIQTGPDGSTGSGSVAGVVLYREGFLVLTGSWTLHSDTFNYINDGSNHKASKWIYWGAGIEGFDYNSGTDITGSHCDIVFEGTNYINTITMLAHAPVGVLNHSNNPTYRQKSSGYLYDVSQVVTSAGSAYIENNTITIKNVVPNDYYNITSSFKKTTFITKVGIYDEFDNLIAVAKVAKPVKKTEDKEYTFKLKLDF